MKTPFQMIPFVLSCVLCLVPRSVGAADGGGGAGHAHAAPTRVNLTLQPGRVPELVSQLESAFELAGVEAALPNLIYDPAVLEKRLEAPSRLVQVEAEDGLALIAAATGCSIEPIFSLQAGHLHGYGTAPVIGYRFTINQAAEGAAGGADGYFGGMAGMGGGMGMEMGSTMGGGMGRGRDIAGGSGRLAKSEPTRPAGGPGGGYSRGEKPKDETGRLLWEINTGVRALGDPSAKPGLSREEVLNRLRELTRHVELVTSEIPTGIGVVLGEEDENILVKTVLPNSPAGRSGKIQGGDRIRRVGEQKDPTVPVDGRDLSDVVALVRGEPGTQVHLVLERGAGPDPEVIDVTLEREKLALPQAESRPRSVEVVFPQAPAGMEAYGGGMGFGGGGLQAGLAADLARYISLGQPAQPPVNKTERSVRVYALGSVLGDRQGDELKARQQDFQELVVQALDLAGNGDGKTPDLAFHASTHALIAKATAAEHDIIQQVIEALSQNLLRR